MTRIAITGAGGYIGSVLVEEALKAGYEVTAIDRFFFGLDLIEEFRHSAGFRTIRKDIREIKPEDFDDADIVVDLAALSNDPAGDLDPDLTKSINVGGRTRTMTVAKDAGVRRYVMASSCSVYGFSDQGELTEASPTNPLTEYAKSMLGAEDHLFGLSGDDFVTTAFRNATVFGLSRRMRFDLVVNIMTKNAVETGKLSVTGGGMQWRPLVHVRDVARCFLHSVKQPAAVVNGQRFNIGLTNIQVRPLAYLVRESLPFPVQIETAAGTNDHRSYSVSYARMRDVLGYKPQFDIPYGVNEIYNAIKEGGVDLGGRTSTVGWYKHLIAADRLVEQVRLNGRIL
jgi:nucleoside-diphosphate-sugar epimerase